VASTGGVLTSAGLVLAGTFSVLALLPVAASREIGIVVALGVLFDTFLVRTILVPTLAADLRRWFWWPTKVPASPEPPESIGEAQPA
jgi:RND superfamily putative drug exporter